jgi:hypothetical protein
VAFTPSPSLSRGFNHSYPALSALRFSESSVRRRGVFVLNLSPSSYEVDLTAAIAIDSCGGGGGKGGDKGGDRGCVGDGPPAAARTTCRVRQWSAPPELHHSGGPVTTNATDGKLHYSDAGLGTAGKRLIVARPFSASSVVCE